jgi:hypothetical protein
MAKIEELKALAAGLRNRLRQVDHLTGRSNERDREPAFPFFGLVSSDRALAPARFANAGVAFDPLFTTSARRCQGLPTRKPSETLTSASYRRPPGWCISLTAATRVRDVLIDPSPLLSSWPDQNCQRRALMRDQRSMKTRRRQ